MSGVKHQDKVSELLPLAPPPEADSATPGPNRKADLGPVVAARLERLCEANEIPPSTMRMLCAQRKGPPTFTIGRLIYCLIEDWNAWMQSIAVLGGTGRLSPPSGRTTEIVRRDASNPPAPLRAGR